VTPPKKQNFTRFRALPWSHSRWGTWARDSRRRRPRGRRRPRPVSPGCTCPRSRSCIRAWRRSPAGRSCWWTCWRRSWTSWGPSASAWRRRARSGTDAACGSRSGRVATQKKRTLLVAFTEKLNSSLFFFAKRNGMLF